MLITDGKLLLKCWDQPLYDFTFVVKERQARLPICSDLHHDALSCRPRPSEKHWQYRRQFSLSNSPVAVASVVFADIKPRETIILIVHTSELDNLTGPVLVER